MQFYNDYESYFVDDALTKSDRKNKLIAAKEGVAAEVEKLGKYGDKLYSLQVELKDEAVTRFLADCVACTCICVATTLILLFSTSGVPERRYLECFGAAHCRWSCAEMAASDRRLDAFNAARW